MVVTVMRYGEPSVIVRKWGRGWEENVLVKGKVQQCGGQGKEVRGKECGNERGIREGGCGGDGIEK